MNNLFCSVVAFAVLVVGAGNSTNTVPPDEKPVEPAKTSVFSGVIEDLHPGARTMEVKAALLTKKFEVAPDCEVVSPDKPKGDLEDLKVGDEVNVTYQDQAGMLVAHRIEQRGVAAARL